jgi:hypothetical protein
MKDPSEDTGNSDSLLVSQLQELAQEAGEAAAAAAGLPFVARHVREVKPEKPVPNDKTGEAFSFTSVLLVLNQPQQKPKMAAWSPVGKPLNVPGLPQAAEEPERFGGRFFVFLFSILVFGLVLGWAFHDKLGSESRSMLTVTDQPKSNLTEAQILQRYLAQKKSTASELDETSIHSFCGDAEGGEVDTWQPVLVDGGKCYVGDQITAHLQEVKTRQALEASQKKAATAALNGFAKKQGTTANDSWRSLAIWFAQTSKLPTADEVALEAYMTHGGKRSTFYDELFNEQSKELNPVPMGVQRQK